MGRYSAALLACGLALLAGCGGAVGEQESESAGSTPAGITDTSAADLGFTHHPQAVDFPGVTDWVPYGSGIRELVPEDDCAIGLGLYRNGYRDVGAVWRGDDHNCTQLRFDPAPNEHQTGPETAQGWQGAPFGSAREVVRLDDGRLLGMTEDSLLRRDLDGSVETVATFDLPRNPPPGEGGDRGGLLAFTPVHDHVVVSGYINDESFLWTVDNDGIITEVAYPLPADEGRPDQITELVAADGVLLAVAAHAGADWNVWASHDAGRSWQPGGIGEVPENSGVLSLHHAEGHWRLLTGGYGGDPTNVAWWDSGDGLTWEHLGSFELGEGTVSGAAIGPDGLPVVMADAAMSDATADGGTACNFIAVAEGSWDDLRWQRGELGCNAWPVTAMTTLDNGAVMIASATDVWVRPVP